MKVTKTEKIWLAVVTIFYLIYNCPGLPKYADFAAGIDTRVATLVHGGLCVVAIWVAVYVGLAKVNKIYALRDEEENK